MADSDSRSAEPVRVLHLTDPHLFADTAGELRGTVTYASLVEVLDHYRASGWDAELIAVTGDLIQDDSAQAYEHFKALLAPLGRPVHCVPGNHDVRGLMQSALADPPFHYCSSVERGNWLMAGIDSCVSDSAGGAISDEEYARLDAMIAASDAEHVLVCLHHPPVAMGSRWLDSVGLDNGARFFERVGASGRVRLVILGHVHQAWDAEHAGIQVVATPSTCRQFKPQSDDFAVDDQPPAYRRILLHPDGRFETELVQVNSKAG